MLPFIRRPSIRLASCSKICLRLTHNPGKPSFVRHRDWGVIGHLSRPPPLSEEVPKNREGEQEEEELEGNGKKARYQTANYTPESDPTPSRWAQHRASMKAKFPQGWAPPHKISRAAIDGLRALHAHDPDTFTTPILANKFCISPEAVRRILRSKWQPTPEQRARLLERERRYRQDCIRSRSTTDRLREKESKLGKAGR